MGAKIKETGDGMIITGSDLRFATVKGHDDHRVIMSLTVAALGCRKGAEIQGADAVAVTFPTFFKLIKNLGAKIVKK